MITIWHKKTCELIAMIHFLWQHAVLLKLAILLFSGYQGTGVLSYFIFLKWMIWLNLFLSIIVLAFVVIPYVTASSIGGYSIGYSTGVTGTNISGVDTVSTSTCTSWYRNNLTYKDDVASYVQDSIQGTVSGKSKKIYISA